MGKTKQATAQERAYNQRRQAYMRALGYNVPKDGSWGPYQNKIWTKLTTRDKKYDTTLSGLVSGLWDKVTGNTTERFDPVAESTARPYNPEEVDWDKTIRSHSKVINAIAGSWLPAFITGATIVGAPAVVAAAKAAPLITATTVAGGMAGGAGVNAISKAATGSDFGTNVAKYTGITPGMGELFNPGYYMGGFAGSKLNSVINKIKSMSLFQKTPQFISELDWSPESWFGTRTTGGYDAADVAALQSHLPEYLQIEQQAKTNGTWLKMPDGSTWEGDPRSWVQLMSKDGQKLQQKPLYHGDSDHYVNNSGEDVTPQEVGSKLLWTSTNKYVPVTYGGNQYQLTIPRETPNVVFDAEGHLWNNLHAPSGYKYITTNDVSYDLLKNNNTVNINNVIDPGPSWIPGTKGLPKGLPKEKIYDYAERVLTGNDIILGKDVPRKSLLGNNGSFDLKNKNIYKTLLPFGLYGLSTTNNKNNGTQ